MASISINPVKQPSFTSKFVTKDLFTNIFTYKGSVDNYMDLPNENLKIGDVYNVVNEYVSILDNKHYPAGTNWVWNGTEWDPQSGDITAQINSAINKLNVEDTAIEGLYISSVSESAGKIQVTRSKFPPFKPVWSVLDPFNGHEYVDLGLPSGTLWATKVVGGDNPLYFQWGDIEGWTAEQINNGEKAFNNSTYKWFDPLTDTYTKYNAIDGKTVLDLEDDTARVHMGGDWQMPTKEQGTELFANTSFTDITQNGINGRLFTSMINGKSVFIPAFGYADGNNLLHVGSSSRILSNSVYNDNLNEAWVLNSGLYPTGLYNFDRSWGNCVLGVISLKS